MAAEFETIEQPILLVENNQDDILLILRAFQRAGVTRRVHAVTSGMDCYRVSPGGSPLLRPGKISGSRLSAIRHQNAFDGRI
jgi:hypothetical protein